MWDSWDGVEMSPVFTMLRWCLDCVIKLKSLKFRKVLFSTDKNVKLWEGIHASSAGGPLPPS